VADLIGDRSDQAELIHDPEIALDPASEQIKKMQERRRTRRRAFPEPPVPIFVMVGPGRYVRVEQHAPSSVATTEGADEDSAEVGILDPAENITIRPEALIREFGNAKGEFGSPRSSEFDLASGTGIDDPVVNELSCVEETADGSEEGPQSDADRLAAAISRS
jgi:hypothetical protein